MGGWMRGCCERHVGFTCQFEVRKTIGKSRTCLDHGETQGKFRIDIKTRDKFRKWPFYWFRDRHDSLEGLGLPLRKQAPRRLRWPLPSPPAVAWPIPPKASGHGLPRLIVRAITFAGCFRGIAWPTPPQALVGLRAPSAKIMSPWGFDPVTLRKRRDTLQPHLTFIC